MSARSTLVDPSSSVTLVKKVCFSVLPARTLSTVLLVVTLVSLTKVLLLMVRQVPLDILFTALSLTHRASTNAVVVERPSMRTRSFVAVKQSGIANVSLARNAV